MLRLRGSSPSRRTECRAWWRWRARPSSTGCAINRASVEAGIRLSYTYLFFFTPKEDERVEVRSTLGMRRLGNRLAESLLMRKAIREGARTIEQDIPIWENKLYRERPLLSEADGPIMQYRRWYRQFYAAGPATGG